MILASGVGLPRVLRRQRGGTGRQFPRLRRGGRFLCGQPGLPHRDRPGQQGAAGNNYDGGAPGPQLRPVPFAQGLFHEAGGEHGQHHGTGHNGEALDQIG